MVTGFTFFDLACVLADAVGVDGGFRQELVPPLVNRNIVGRDYKRARRNLPQNPEADDRLARPAGEHDNPAAPGCAAGVVEGLDRVGLVVAQVKRPSVYVDAPEEDVERVAGSVAAEVFYRVADLDEGMLDLSAVRDPDMEPVRRLPAPEAPQLPILA